MTTRARRAAGVRPPQWKALDRLRPWAVPAGLWDWLADETSLTRRLRQVCPGGFRVRVLHQGWGRPLRGERRLLRVRDREYALVREVQLLCGGQPWVYGRTVIPVRTLSGARRALARLGERPLGASLFAERSTRRVVVEAARLVPGQSLYEAAVAALDMPVPAVWGRRSVFRLKGKPLLVSEVFLPPVGGARVGGQRARG